MKLDSYAWRSGNPGTREAMLRMGPHDGPFVLILQPLFEEANRTRRILVEVMRGLATRGIASVLPDLPGTGDSKTPTVDARFAHWREAVDALATTLPCPLHSVAIRGGALLDGFADHRWQLAPETGKRLLRDMLRATALTGEVKAAELEARARIEPVRLAGNLLHPDLFVALETTEPVAGAHIAELAGAPWRRAEPGDDPELVGAMVADITDWMTTCAAR